MYVIIGSHFVPLEGKFLLMALVIRNNIDEVFESLTTSVLSMDTLLTCLADF
jgi:hypothetical protein